MKLSVIDSKKNVKQGKCTNGMEIYTVGDGKKDILLLLGGPGNTISLSVVSIMHKWLKDIIGKGYRLCIVSRKSGLSVGYTSDQMAEDIIDIIEKDLGGKIACLLGTSLGGFMVPYIAAKRPELVENFVMLASAYKVNDGVHDFDRNYAKMMSQGKAGLATSRLMGKCFNSPLKNFLAEKLTWIIAPLMNKAALAGSSPTFSKDVLIEVEAEVAHNAKELLGQIEVPVLVLACDKDFWFSKDLYYETADLMPKGKLIMLENTAHMGTTTKVTASAIDDFLHDDGN